MIEISFPTAITENFLNSTYGLWKHNLLYMKLMHFQTEHSLLYMKLMHFQTKKIIWIVPRYQVPSNFGLKLNFWVSQGTTLLIVAWF